METVALDEDFMHFNPKAIHSAFAQVRQHLGRWGIRANEWDRKRLALVILDDGDVSGTLMQIASQPTKEQDA